MSENPLIVAYIYIKNQTCFLHIRQIRKLVRIRSDIEIISKEDNQSKMMLAVYFYSHIHLPQYNNIHLLGN